MPKELVVNNWCDPCYAADEKVPGEEVTVALGDLGRMKPRTMLLCERHRKEFYEPLRELAEQHGDTSGEAPTVKPQAKRGGGRPSIAELTCPVCGHQATTKDALRAHARAAHDKSLAELKGEPLPHECPECSRRFENGQGLAAHRRTQHGVAGASRNSSAVKGASSRA